MRRDGTRESTFPENMAIVIFTWNRDILYGSLYIYFHYVKNDASYDT